MGAANERRARGAHSRAGGPRGGPYSTFRIEPHAARDFMWSVAFLFSCGVRVLAFGVSTHAMLLFTLSLITHRHTNVESQVHTSVITHNTRVCSKNGTEFGHSIVNRKVAHTACGSHTIEPKCGKDRAPRCTQQRPVSTQQSASSRLASPFSVASAGFSRRSSTSDNLSPFGTTSVIGQDQEHPLHTRKNRVRQRHDHCQ